MTMNHGNMDPPSSPDDINSVELRPLVSSDRQIVSTDAPADDVALSWPSSRNGSGSGSSSARWARSSSRPPLPGGGSHNKSAPAAAQQSKRRNNTINHNNIQPVASVVSRVVVEEHAEYETIKRKKMALLLMMTFVVALLGAILAKRSAVMTGTNSTTTGMGSEISSQTPVLHESIIDLEQQQPSSNNEDDLTSKHTTTSNTNNINLDGYQPTTMIYPTSYILPGITDNAPPLSAAKGRPYYPILNHFQFRNPSSPYASTWGYFNFRDPNPKWDGRMRPQPTNYDNVPNRDVKNIDFPKDSWQSDTEYMKEFLVQAKLLVNRTIEAIYAEYGVGIPSDGSVTLTDEQLVNRELFAPFILMADASVTPPGDVSWSTRSSFDGTARRFIHHIMTGDTFKLTLGGHSAAAGHGAGFNQSYVIEAGHVLEPVFAHLGVEFRAYNFAQGGMGTFQQSMAGMDLRGKETDWIIWDSSMTEKSPEIVNFFFRQALISGNRSPVLMGDNARLNEFHDIAGAAIAASAANGWVPVTENDEQVMTLPWAAQWLQCSRTATTDCKSHEYTAGCWVEREDFSPTTAQNAIVGGAAAWHPGNRVHKRRGRLIALVVLRSLAYALDKWEELGAKSGYPIAEEHWHVSEYYKSIREKATQVPGCFGDNWKIGQKRHLEDIMMKEVADNRTLLDNEDYWPSRLCDIPLQGRSLWGPRSNPMESSLLSIMKANAFGDIDPTPNNAYLAGPLYNPPDRPAPWTVPPDTEPFAPLIGASRRMIVDEQTHHQLRGSDMTSIYNGEIGTRTLEEDSAAEDTSVMESNETESIGSNRITPGLGIQVKWGLPGVCDGSSHSWCEKTPENNCLMGGAQDSRGMVCFDGFSGWVVFDVKDVKHGFIGARMEPWHGAEETPITATWTEENNGGNGNYNKQGLERQLHDDFQQEQMRESIDRMKREIENDVLSEDDPSRRRLGGGQSCGNPADYTFEWAINGDVTSWNKAEFCDHFTRLNYNLDVIKFMDDESQTGDFELAMRVTNVGRGMAMCISHLYWA